MGLTLTLTDNEIPASPAFIEFLYASLMGEDYHAGEWFAQEKEGLAHNQERFNNIREKAGVVLADSAGKESVIRSYRFFKEMLTGRPNHIHNMKKFRFYFVVGIPRTGGTYLTKQLFRAAQIDYKTVQNALAHDGFPHLAHMEFKNKGNVHTNGLLQLAEYLTMVELYYSKHGKLTHDGGIVVPKKFTKAVYNFPLIQEVFGASATYLITLRHPLSVIKSVLDKSGGMPENEKFAVRSAIERWAMEDWMYWGTPEKEIKEMDYVEVMLGYWKRFHYKLALAGIPHMPNARIIPFGKEPMNKASKKLFNDFGVDIKPETFKTSELPSFESKETKKAEHVLQDVNQFWKSLGLEFPAKALAKMA